MTITLSAIFFSPLSYLSSNALAFELFLQAELSAVDGSNTITTVPRLSVLEAVAKVVLCCAPLATEEDAEVDVVAKSVLKS